MSTSSIRELFGLQVQVNPYTQVYGKTHVFGLTLYLGAGFIVLDRKQRGTMSMTIGAVAKQAGLGIQTVRFYEREGLIEEPPRSSSGYRAYDERALFRLRFIRRAQELGFTLKEIRELIALEQDQDADCDQVRGVASSKLTTVENKIADLQRMQNALQRLIQSCNANGPIRDCVLMDCLQSSTECEEFSPRRGGLT